MRISKRILSLFLSSATLCSLLLSGCASQQETKAYTFHDVYIGAASLVESHKDGKSCEDIYLNEDGSLTLVLTESQRKRWADPSQTEAMLVVLKMMGIEIFYSDEYTKMNIFAPDGVAEAAAPMICNFAWAAELYQVLNGTENWSLEVTVINSDTGQTVQQLTLPEDELDWSFIEQ